MLYSKEHLKNILILVIIISCLLFYVEIDTHFKVRGKWQICNNNNNNNCLKSNIQCIEIRVQWTMHLGSSHMHVHVEHGIRELITITNFIGHKNYLNSGQK